MSPSRQRYDLIAIGDSTLDVFVRIHEATISCRLDKDQCLFCLEYAEKIPVDRVVRVPGAGNASNAAVGGARLGMRSAIVSILGHDETGQAILKHWKREGVSEEYVQIDSKRETNYSTVITFKGERTILSYSNPRHYALPALDGTTWIYYTALGPKHEHLEKQLLRHLAKHPKQHLAFNPGTQQLHRGLAAIKPVIARSSLFTVNKEEAIRLLEDGERPIANMLLSFYHMGAKTVVITDGPKGSYGTDGKEIWQQPIFPGPITERTGAGDSFTIGLVYGLFSNKHFSEAMRYGTANAWSVVQKIGPQAGLLYKKELLNVVKKFSHLRPKVILNTK